MDFADLRTRWGSAGGIETGRADHPELRGQAPVVWIAGPRFAAPERGRTFFLAADQQAQSLRHAQSKSAARDFDMTKISLRPDCANCAALCCMALAFDRSDLFAIDKPAGEACPHLDACGACVIHGERIERGFAGCVDFDCLGAGQRTTRLFLARGTWMKDPALIGPMSRAFGHLLRAHEYLSLLDLAETLDISPADRTILTELRGALEDAGIHGGEIVAVQARIDAFLKSLRGYVGHATRPQGPAEAPGA